MQKYFFVFFAGIVLTILVFFGWNKSSKNKINVQPPLIIANGCYIQGCHGLDIQCGPSKVEVCDLMYQLGDGCRQLARCETANGKCEQILNSKFNNCKSCVENCKSKYTNDPVAVGNCETSCY
ncbi:MAG: hypothetical protein ACD_26C00111G0003 [uncultured bacterium]|nr:MAG: hypothetical protein ACD_26C00111G0003 [uncultured bacterium]